MVTGFSIEITNFDNAAMRDYPNTEVVRLLKECIKRIDQVGLDSVGNKFALKDSNGNTVGYMSVGTD